MNAEKSRSDQIIENLSYPAAWDAYFSQLGLLDGTIELLKDYCGEKSWLPGTIFSFEYYHTHKEVIRDFLISIERARKINPNMTAQEFFDELEKTLRDANQPLNPTGGLVKRLAYASHTQELIDLGQLCDDLSEEAIKERSNRNDYK